MHVLIVECVKSMDISDAMGFPTRQGKDNLKKGGKDGIFNNHHHRAQVFSRS